MVISGVIKRLIINFSPFIRLTSWGCQVCLCQFCILSRKHTLDVLCYTAYFCEIAKLSMSEMNNSSSEALQFTQCYLALRITVHGSETWYLVGSERTALVTLSTHKWDSGDTHCIFERKNFLSL